MFACKDSKVSAIPDPPFKQVGHSRQHRVDGRLWLVAPHASVILYDSSQHQAGTGL